MLAPNPVLLLGVCTPAQLAEWPISGWTVLDVDDGERAVRLRRRGEPDHVIHEANSDAAEYRALGLRTIDVTALTLEGTASAIATIISLAGRLGDLRFRRPLLVIPVANGDLDVANASDRAAVTPVALAIARARQAAMRKSGSV